MSHRAQLGRRALLAGLAAGAWAIPAVAHGGLRGPAATLPRAGLWPAPAPIEAAPALAAALGLTGGLWMVRDDRAGATFNDGTSLGGGKARKLDLLLGDALARGVTTVATTGGIGSNHARAVAVAARALGLGCRLALLPEPSTAATRRNLDAIAASGATVTVGGRDGVTRLAREAESSSGRIAWVPMGGTTPLGDLAFVEAAFELAAHVRSGAVPGPATVVTALGSGGSAVGLAVGLALAGLATRVEAVRCSSPSTSSRAAIDAEVQALVAWLRSQDPSIPDVTGEARARLSIATEQLGGGYAVSTAASRRATALWRAHAGVELDGTYAAKAAAHVARGAPSTAGPIVLWLGCDARWLSGAAASGGG